MKMTIEKTEVEKTMDELVQEVTARQMAAGVFQLASKKKKKTNWEGMLAREYVEKFYGEYPHWYRIELGAVPNGSTNPLYTKVRRWADCVIRMPDHMEIIELKMLAKPEVSAQLKNYMQLFPQTPLFKKYWEEPLEGKVVCAMVSDDTRRFLESQGITVEIYKPV